MRRYLTCVFVDHGIIGVIDESGVVVNYCLRGLKKLTRQEKYYVMNKKIIRADAFNLDELPREITPVFENAAMKQRVSFDKKWIYGDK